MLFLHDFDLALDDTKLKQSDEIVGHELCRNRPANQGVELFRTDGNILPGLDGG
jgi:hypothetical protein